MTIKLDLYKSFEFYIQQFCQNSVRILIGENQKMSSKLNMPIESNNDFQNGFQ